MRPRRRRASVPVSPSIRGFMMRSSGGVTFGELLILLLIIGIAAVVVWALPGWEGNPDGRHIAATKSDLKNLVGAQEGFFADSGRYYSGPIAGSDLQSVGFNLEYETTSGVTVALTSATDSGWAAVATNERVPDLICRIYIGPRPAFQHKFDEGQHEGEVTCKRAR